MTYLFFIEDFSEIQRSQKLRLISNFEKAQNLLSYKIKELCFRQRQNLNKKKWYVNKLYQQFEQKKSIDEEIVIAEKQLQQNREELMKAKKQVIGKDEHSLMKKIKIDQLKIDQQKIRQNELIAKHSALKSNINFLREERCIFENITKQLEIDLQQNKNELREILNESELTMKQIFEAKERLNTAKKDAVITQRDFDKEIQTIYKILNKENKTEKLKEVRKKLDKSPKSVNNDDSQLQDEDQQAYLTEFEENLYRKNQQKKNKSAITAESIQNTKQEVQKHEEIFNQLKQETGKENMSDIIQIFIHQEEKNFSLLKYINALSDDLEGLVKQKKSLTEEQAKLLQPSIGQNDPKYQKMDSIKKEIAALQKKDEIFDQKEKELMKIINALKISIPIIFERIGCNNDEYLKEMGDLITQSISDINENNILQFLGVIEKRTNEILQMYNDVFGNIYEQDPLEKKKSQDDQNNVIHETEFMKTLNKLEENFTESLKFEKEAEIKDEKELLNEAKQEINKMLGKPEHKKSTKRKF